MEKIYLNPKKWSDYLFVYLFINNQKISEYLKLIMFPTVNVMYFYFSYLFFLKTQFVYSSLFFAISVFMLAFFLSRFSYISKSVSKLKDTVGLETKKQSRKNSLEKPTIKCLLNDFQIKILFEKLNNLGLIYHFDSLHNVDVYNNFVDFIKNPSNEKPLIINAESQDVGIIIDIVFLQVWNTRKRSNISNFFCYATKNGIVKPIKYKTISETKHRNTKNGFLEKIENLIADVKKSN